LGAKYTQQGKDARFGFKEIEDSFREKEVK
jgi:hypothetical protein